MKQEIHLLEHGLFEKHFMDSRATTRAVSKKELVFGHLLGPLGLIFIVNTIAALVEKFFTQQVGAMYGTANVDMIRIMGGRYEVIMTVAKLLAMGTGLLNGWLVQHTTSRQGRMRPWYLIFGFASIAIGALIFQFPGQNGLGDSYWYYFFFLLICYHTIGSSYFFVFKDSIVSLTSRSPSEKMRIKFVRQLCWTLISGILIGMMVSMVVLPMWLEKDIHGYPVLMGILSLVAIPLLLLEYFFTRERITEDVAQENGIAAEAQIPLRQQMKALLSNKYFLILTILTTVGSIVDNFKGGNVSYFYIKFMLGGAENPLMFTLYQVITGIPLGIGAFAVYPLAKKFGIRNVTFVGYISVLLGSILLQGKAPRLPRGRVAAECCALGLWQTTAQYAFYYIAVAMLTGAFGGILNSTQSFLGVIFAHFIYGNADRMTPAKTLGCAVGFAGVLIGTLGNHGSGSGWGVFCMMAATIIFTLSGPWNKSVTKKADSFAVCFINLFVGGLALFVLGTVLGGSLHVQSALAVVVMLYLAFICGAGYILWALLMKNNPVSRIAIFGFVNPVVNVLLSAVLNGEPLFRWQYLAALVFVCVGIWLVNKAPAQKEKV